MKVLRISFRLQVTFGIYCAHNKTRLNPNYCARGLLPSFAFSKQAHAG